MIKKNLTDDGKAELKTGRQQPGIFQYGKAGDEHD